MSFNRKQAYLYMMKKGLLDMMPLNLAVIPWVYCVAHWRYKEILVF